MAKSRTIKTYTTGAVGQLEQQRERRHELAVFREMRDERRVEFVGANLRFEFRQPLDEEFLRVGSEAKPRRVLRVQFHQLAEDARRLFL